MREPRLSGQESARCERKQGEMIGLHFDRREGHIRRISRTTKLLGLGTTFVTGVLLAAAIASGGIAADTTTTTPTTTVESTTAETTTAETTATETTPTSAVTTTVQVTTTRVLPVNTSTTSSSDDDETPAWVWVLLAMLAVGLIGLIVLLARRGGGGGPAPADAGRGKLDAAVASWTAQGWAIESQTADSAVLRRGQESMLVTVDSAGHVSTRPLPSA